jgi:hypothetical protein
VRAETLDGNDAKWVSGVPKVSGVSVWYSTPGAGLPAASSDQMFKPLALTVSFVHGIIACCLGRLIDWLTT